MSPSPRPGQRRAAWVGRCRLSRQTRVVARVFLECERPLVFVNRVMRAGD
ncbi:hypothetical protein SSIG_02168 [Streptomyces filamentosus NRRL 11379]|uniref:Predicted protein n=1 Tax=Streptomyces filamentosus NRRL 15998 TaxID=457431 RepID=D6ADA5_STRFL|nr:predicted protein [Streptomyces filamentosus NRRL 15998]EWS91718.1 hypothetical protein SSIG_02168 [Streptomyces filamentosus NRRL 11379]